MRLLLDECIPRRLKDHFASHDVTTVPDEGWSGIKNSELLRAAESSFDAVITVDRKLPFQQDLASIDLVIVLLKAPSNDIDDLIPLIPRLLEALAKVGDRTLIEIEA